MKITNYNKKGFTLFEFIFVIAVIAILAAIAIPKYLDVVKESKLASAESFAVAMASASTVNYEICKNSGPLCKKQSGTNPVVSNCSEFINLLVNSKLPRGMKITPTTAFTEKPGDAVTCTVTYDGHSTDFEAVVPPAS